MSVLDERFDLNLLRHATRYQRWLIDQFGPAVAGDIVEVGPGIGNFTRWLSEKGRSVTVVEPEPAMCDEVAGLGLPNVRIVRGRLEDVAAEVPPCDTAFLCNVLEHIADDGGALEMAHALLRPGGHVCVVVPAHQQLFGSLDARYGHLRRYRRGEVHRALVAAGFVDVQAEYFNPVGALGWLAVSRIARRPRLSPGSVALSEQLAVPLGRLLRRLGRPPFGQSVVATGRRRPSP